MEQLLVVQEDRGSILATSYCLYCLWHKVAGIKRKQSWKMSLLSFPYDIKLILAKPWGCGGSTSGWATNFCPSGLGSNSRSTLGFFRQNLSLFLLGIGLFLLEWIIERRQCLTLLFFPVSYHHQLTLCQSIVIEKKRNKNANRKKNSSSAIQGSS